MSDKCAEHDKKIEHYRRIRLSIGDQTTVERLEAMIADLQAQKQRVIRSQSSRAPPLERG